MKQKLTIITIFLLCFSQTAFAHSDFYIVKDFGNVKVRIKTGFEYEEINKITILGKLAQRLASELKYNKQVLLDFHHHYTSDCQPSYFISFDRGKIEHSSESTWNEKSLLKRNGIVVRFVARSINFTEILKLLENSIKNVETIKKEQHLIKYEKKYCQWKINTIDSILINKTLMSSESKLLRKVIDFRINRPNHENDYGISYYWQNSRYHIFMKYGTTDEERNLIDVNNIYQFEDVKGSKVLFDTDSTFYFLSHSRSSISKKNLIENLVQNYRPFEISPLGRDKVSISFWYYLKGVGYKERILLFFIKQDELVQDLGKIIDKEQ